MSCDFCDNRDPMAIIEVKGEATYCNECFRLVYPRLWLRLGGVTGGLLGAYVISFSHEGE